MEAQERYYWRESGVGRGQVVTDRGKETYAGPEMWKNTACYSVFV